MASPGRFELPASRLGGARSIQLSYGDLRKFYRRQPAADCLPPMT